MSNLQEPLHFPEEKSGLSDFPKKSHPNPSTQRIGRSPSKALWKAAGVEVYTNGPLGKVLQRRLWKTSTNDVTIDDGECKGNYHLLWPLFRLVSCSNLPRWLISWKIPWKSNEIWDDDMLFKKTSGYNSGLFHIPFTSQLYDVVWTSYEPA